MGSIIVDMDAQKPDLVNGPVPPSYAPVVWRESACRLVERIRAYGTKVFMQIGFGHGRQKPGQKAPPPIPRYADPNEICEISKLLESYGYDMLDCNSGIYDSFNYAVAPEYMEKWV